MKLTSSNANNFYKFNVIGDKIEGYFVSYKEGVEGRFGPENQLSLNTTRCQPQSTDGDVTIVRCQTHLASLIAENVADLDGKWLKIEYIKDRPTAKGSPMKIFDVDVEDGPGVTDAGEAGDGIPF